MTTGERIKAARKAAGMTQQELAKKLGVSYTLVSQYERNLRNPKYVTLQKIAVALGVSTADLFSDEQRLFYPGMRAGDTFFEGRLIVKDIKLREDGLCDVTFGTGIEGQTLEEVMEIMLKIQSAAKRAGVSPEGLADLAEQIAMISTSVQSSPSEAQKAPSPSEDETTPENKKSPE